MTGELPPDPFPEYKAHCLARFEHCPIGHVHVICVDCDNTAVGLACCEPHAVEIIEEHARRMGTT